MQILNKRDHFVESEVEGAITDTKYSISRTANCERILFQLDDDWALGCDSLQWILYRSYFKRDTARYVPWSFIATTKDVLLRVMHERGICLTQEAQNKIDNLPYSFREFVNLTDAAAMSVDITVEVSG